MQNLKYKIYHNSKNHFKLNIIAIWFLLFIVTSAQSSEVISIKYNNQLLRDISSEYFNNPDYWQTILKFNNLESSSDLVKGMSLKIPIGIVNSTLEKFNIAGELIAEANKNGAKVLTKKSIEKIEFDYNTALLFKLQSNWSEAYTKLGDVIENTKKTIAEVNKLRSSSADATISFRKGSVEKRKPKQKLWSDAELYSKLFEADRARTLSNSMAEITFLDLSRIRLNENSDAVIQHSRIDLLKNKTETKVKLVRGDAFAYLLKSPKKKFDIDIPGLNANIKSKSFWVEKGDSDTKIANYEGEIELVSKNKAVVVKENQGSVIPDGGEPSNPTDLLLPPELLAPENKSKLFIADVTFKWSAVEEINQYWFQLSTDSDFRNLVYSRKNINENSFSISDLEPAIYYWRVCSIDKTNLPGEFSSKNYFMVSKDISKPFLVIYKPQNQHIVKNSTIVLEGESEKGVSIFIDGNKIQNNSNGYFKHELSLVDGKNVFTVSAIDESNNKSHVNVNCYYESSPNIENKILNKNYSEKDSTFVSDGSEILIKGNTRPLSKVSFNYGTIVKSTYADTNGVYIILLTNLTDDTNIIQTIISPANYSLITSFRFNQKIIIPKIIIESAVPRITKNKRIIISGRVENSDSLFVNSKIVSVENNTFTKPINLEEGENTIRFQAKGDFESIIEKTIYITSDSQPPTMLSHQLISDSKNRKEYILFVKASDVSGLPKIAKAILEMDNIKKEIVLTLNSNSAYSKRIYLNKSDSKPRLVEVVLEDYLGNSKKYQIGNK